MQTPEQFLQAGVISGTHPGKLDADAFRRIGVADDPLDASFSLRQRKQQLQLRTDPDRSRCGDEDAACAYVAYARDRA